MKTPAPYLANSSWGAPENSVGKVPFGQSMHTRSASQGMPLGMVHVKPDGVMTGYHRGKVRVVPSGATAGTHRGHAK